VRIAVVSWEYPPLVIGGISAHVDGLARALARAGCDVVVLTMHHPDAEDDAVVDGVRVLRARTDLPWLPDDQFVARMASANHHLVALAAALDDWRPDVVHAHDWLVAWAGNSLSSLWDRPLVATIHATERGRNGGHLAPGQPSAINSVEWWLTYQAATVICCSQFMRAEVTGAFQLPPDKVRVVPNGVDPEVWAAPPGAVRAKDREALLVSWGRVQYEKGFQTLLYALPEVRLAVPGVRAVVAGRGSYLAELHETARAVGVDDICDFPGFVPDDQLRALLHRATLAVIPSLYEPFGIVALEAMAAGAPVVAAASGGLAEVIDSTGAGVLFPPGDAGALSGILRRLLADQDALVALQRTAHALLSSHYTWDAVAALTLPAYSEAVATRPRR
jgi:glycogen(starch) synthase